MEARRAEAAITSEVNSGSGLALEKRTKCASKLDNVGACQFGFRNAADVVFAENGRFEHGS